MTLDRLIEEIKQKAKNFYIKPDRMPYDLAHDWGHATRVYNNAKAILHHHQEANSGEVLITAILHDAGHSLKIDVPHAEASFILATDFFTNYESEFRELNLSKEKMLKMIKYHTVAHDCPCKEIAASLEFQILADADKIDLFGPIGIVRVAIDHNRQGYDSVLEILKDEASADNYVFITDGGKKVGGKYKEYIKKFTEDLESQQKDLGFSN